MMRIAWAVLLLSGLPHTASAQSFDCARAQTRIENMICADAGLRELDEYLGRYYAAGRTELGNAASCFQSDQTQWLTSTRNVCQNATCLRTAYLNRLGELDGLQPGATAIRNITLPRVPALSWVIAPAADKVAAPPKPNARPLEMTGVILDEVANGDGFMLRSANGTKVPLMLLMFLEGKTQDRLSVLSKETGATFRARGYAASDGNRTYFEPSRCTFIHRMPQTTPRASNGAGPEQQMDNIRLTVLTQGKVCADPNRPCPGFKPNELSFAIAKPFAFDRGRDKSQPFYAVILKSGALCGIGDDERIRAQSDFPAAKVFVHRHFCEDFGDKVTYSNVDARSGFLAVYAGETEADARTTLAKALAAGYTGANIRRMEAIVVYQVE